MKLELKHLSGYLPYGLNIKILNYQCDYVGIEYSEITGYYFIGSSLHVNYKGGSTGKSIDIFRPILRPLSDLTKEIEVSGEKFVPNYILNNSFRAGSKDLMPYKYTGYNLELNIETENYSQTIDLFDGFLIVQKLLEWHFDIYGLIDAELAIDINTL
jgi:hypothetical protein